MYYRTLWNCFPKNVFCKHEILAKELETVSDKLTLPSLYF